jgi:hypothetical protein
MSKPRRTAVDKLLSYSLVRDEEVSEEERPLISKLILSLTKENISASAHLPIPFLHALTWYADTPRALYVLQVMQPLPFFKEYWDSESYKDKWGNTFLASLCARAYFSVPAHPVRVLVDQLGGKATPSDGCSGKVTDYLK